MAENLGNFVILEDRLNGAFPQTEDLSLSGGDQFGGIEWKPLLHGRPSDDQRNTERPLAAEKFM